LQEVGDGLRALALLEPQAAQLTTDPFVEALQVALAVGVAEAGHPAGLIAGFCSSAPGFVSGFLPTPPRGDAVAFG